MAYSLEEINFRTVADPEGFVRECDAEYQRKVSTAAERIIENRARSPIVLLSGPSGSGKSTAARCIMNLYRPDAGHIFKADAGIFRRGGRLCRA